MINLKSFDLQMIGALSSIAGLLPSFMQWFTSEYRAKHGKKKEETAELIQHYIEWLRRQRHKEILNKLETSCEAQASIEKLLRQLRDESDKKQKAILAQFVENSEIVHEQWDRIEYKVDRILFKEPIDTTKEERKFEKEYLGQVKREFQRLRVLGVSEMRQIRQELSIAYVSLNLKKTSTKEETTSEEEEEIEDMQSHNAENVLRNNPLMTIRGPAGSGKTTLLRWLALQCTMTNVESDDNPWRHGIPFHIPLRRLVPSDQGKPKLERFVSYTIDPDVWSKQPPDGWIANVLEQKRALVLIDGVDELPPKVRPKFWTWLDKFVQHQPGNRVYVTSRPFPEPDDKTLGPLWNPPPEFVPAELDEMNDQDVKLFINNWHNAVILQEDDEQEKIDLQRTRDTLPARLLEPRNRTVRELCRTPLLCALVCAMHGAKKDIYPLPVLTCTTAVVRC